MKILGQLLIAIISVLFIGVSAYAEEQNPKDIAIDRAAINEMLAIFREKNSHIHEVEISDIRPVFENKIKTGYVVIAKGIVNIQREPESSRIDELFGFFIMDKQLSRLLGRLDVVPTEKQYDYWYKIKNANLGLLEVYGADRYGVDEEVRNYSLTNIQWSDKAAPKNSLKVGGTGAPRP